MHYHLKRKTMDKHKPERKEPNKQITSISTMTYKKSWMSLCSAVYKWMFGEFAQHIILKHKDVKRLWNSATSIRGPNARASQGHGTSPTELRFMDFTPTRRWAEKQLKKSKKQDTTMASCEALLPPNTVIMEKVSEDESSSMKEKMDLQTEGKTRFLLIMWIK